MIEDSINNGEINLRQNLKPDDIGYLTFMHGLIYNEQKYILKLKSRT